MAASTERNYPRNHSHSWFPQRIIYCFWGVSFATKGFSDRDFDWQFNFAIAISIDNCSSDARKVVPINSFPRTNCILILYFAVIFRECQNRSFSSSGVHMMIVFAIWVPSCIAGLAFELKKTIPIVIPVWKFCIVILSTHSYIHIFIHTQIHT